MGHSFIHLNVGTRASRDIRDIHRVVNSRTPRRFVRATDDGDVGDARDDDGDVERRRARDEDDARRRREEARKEKLRAELADVKDGGVAKKGKKKKKTSAILSFEEVDE